MHKFATIYQAMQKRAAVAMPTEAEQFLGDVLRTAANATPDDVAQGRALLSAGLDKSPIGLGAVAPAWSRYTLPGGGAALGAFAGGMAGHVLARNASPAARLASILALGGLGGAGGYAAGSALNEYMGKRRILKGYDSAMEMLRSLAPKMQAAGADVNNRQLH